jgi:hypothetical protein
VNNFYDSTNNVI